MLEKLQGFVQSTRGRSAMAILLTIYVASILISQFVDFRPIQLFQNITHTRQNWVMFNTIPEKRTFRMVAISDTGEMISIIDDENQDPKGFRYRYHINNILRPENEALLQELVGKLASGFNQSNTFQIIVERDLIRDLYHSKKDRNLYKKDRVTLGPYPVNQ